MARRLLLGCSAVGNTLVERVRESRAEIVAVTDDTGWASTLRDRNVATVEADPTDPAAYPDRAAVVLVASDDPARNVASARAARERYPEAMIVAHVGTAPSAEQVDAIAAVADHVVDPVDAVRRRILHAVDVDDPEAAVEPEPSRDDPRWNDEGADRETDDGDGADGSSGEDGAGVDENGGDERPARLVRTLHGLSGPLLVVAHDNPDPDAIASALGLVQIAEHVGVAADACYGGDITHQENRAMMNLLELSLQAVDDLELDEYGGVALVDHSRAGINDSLPEGTDVDVVIDHHPPRGPVGGGFVDVRPGIGAASTLIEEYLSRLGIEPAGSLATALLYGIRIDTKNFTREVSTADFEAAAALTPVVDHGVLERVESPSMSAETLRVLATAIEGRDVRGSIAASCVGEISDRDALAQAADRLLNLEDVTVTFVYGYMDGVVYGSARARGTDVDVGELLRDALEQAGSAGGHANMAGAQVPLGILQTVSDDEELSAVVEEFVSERFFEAVDDLQTPSAGPAETDSAEYSE